MTIAEDAAAVARSAAERMTTAIEQAVAARRSAVVCLTGGSTPRELYALLASEQHPWRSRIPWTRVHLFWGDERHVPPDHEDSNFGMAERALIRRVPVPASQVHRMRGEIPDARDAARDYAATLAAGFTQAGRDDRTFDVMLLGLGEDAHIASIFPGSELLRARVAGDDGARAGLSDAERVAGVFAPHLDAWRITLTPDAILDARALFVIVAGASKASAVRAALEGPPDIVRCPAQILRDAAEAHVEWIVDREAAAELGPTPG